MRSDKRGMKISQYVHIFKKDGFVALWHSLNMNKVYGSRELLEACKVLGRKGREAGSLKKIPRKVISLLTAKGMIVKDGDDEKALLDNIRKKAGGFNIKNLVLLVSNNCNFRCSYCQIEENMKAGQMVNMTKKTAAGALDLFKKNTLPQTKKTVTITGGEPLLNMKVVEYVIGRIRKEFSNTRIVIFTNGSLLNGDMARYFKENDVLMLVSLDGPKKMHDAVRRDKRGQGTFEAAFNGYKMLREAGCSVGISAVGGRHNIKELDKTLAFFTSLKPPSIGFNFSHYLIDKDNPTEIPIAEFGRILIKFYEEARMARIFVENISRPISAFSTNAPKINECQAQGHGFTVDARGKVGPCKSLVVADVFSEDLGSMGRIEDNGMFREWSMRSPVIERGCRECPAITICGGGCAYDSYIANKGDFKKIDKRICEYERNVLEYLIWDLFKKIEDKVRADKVYSPSAREQAEAFSSYYDKKNELQRSVGHEKDK